MDANELMESIKQSNEAVLNLLKQVLERLDRLERNLNVDKLTLVDFSGQVSANSVSIGGDSPVNINGDVQHVAADNGTVNVEGDADRITSNSGSINIEGDVDEVTGTDVTIEGDADEVTGTDITIEGDAEVVSR